MSSPPPPQKKGFGTPFFRRKKERVKLLHNSLPNRLPWLIGMLGEENYVIFLPNYINLTLSINMKHVLMVSS